jgi:protein transport protein SEC31
MVSKIILIEAPGDRSHILPSDKPIFDILTSVLNAVKAKANPPQRKHLDDAEKRLNLLFDKLNNQFYS